MASVRGAEGLRRCDEPGCVAFSSVKGDPFEVGKPPGDTTWMQKFSCGDGHHYMIDLLTEARVELE